jgi:5-(hydroxymethyl)furfural/furfural oxidase
MEDWDVLIIGGGTAGAVMAARLSEDAGRRVLLVEAGIDTPPGETPEDIADTFPRSALNRDYLWSGLVAATREGSASRPYPQARVMGGGSSINGMLALRGLPSDYDRWAIGGAAGWSALEVTPWFRRIEDDAARPGMRGGTTPIHRLPEESWPAYVRAIQQAAVADGYSHVGDINEHAGDGFFAMPLSATATRRATSAQSYLTHEVRLRPNLLIMSGVRVERLHIDGNVATGVRVLRGKNALEVRAGTVVLCAGAIHSPAILLRSGIGPADELKFRGIEARLDLPGVGKNLQNHPYLFFALTLPRDRRMSRRFRQFAIAGLRASSNCAGSFGGDLFLFLTGRVSGRGFGTGIGMIAAALYSPLSKGEVTLAGDDSALEPRVDFRMLSDERDAPRLLKAARLAEELLLLPSVAATYNDAVLLPPALSLNQFNRPGIVGSILGMGAELVLDGPGFLRRAALAFLFGAANRISPGYRLSDQALLEAIAPMGHPVGTCRFGRTDDPMAVTDPFGRVLGTRNLFVGDASVMPILPSANTNLPTLMVAERIADGLRRSL